MPPLQIPQRDVDRAQRLDRQSLLAVVAQPVVQTLPMQLGCERVRADQQGLVVVGDRGGQPRWTKGFAPPAHPILADDLDQHCPTALIPGLRIGERLSELRLQSISLDLPDVHRTDLAARVTSGLNYKDDSRFLFLVAPAPASRKRGSRCRRLGISGPCSGQGQALGTRFRGSDGENGRVPSVKL